MTTLRASRALLPDALLLDPWTLQQRVAMLVDGEGVVVGLCPPDELPQPLTLESFPGEIWTAAPVMAHAHLESYDAPSGDWDRSSFCTWVEDLLAWRASNERLDPATSAALSRTELGRFGCGMVLSHVGELGAEGGALPGQPEVLALAEVFAPDAADFPALALASGLEQGGLALHAPYSVVAEVAASVFRAFRRRGLVSIHLGEHGEERRLLSEGGGPMADLLQRHGRSLGEGRWASPVAWLTEVGGMQAGTLVVHGGDLETGELQALHMAQVGLVFCPGTHLYFDRPATRFVASGIPLPALGCDSRASNERLDPLREVSLAWSMMPQPGPQAWWEALTCRGAELLQRSDLGRIAVGRRGRVLRLREIDRDQAKDAQELCALLCSGQALTLQVSEFSGFKDC